MSRRTTLMLGVCGMLLVAAGCRGGLDYETAPVSGTVTCNGDPVPGGHLQFVPANPSGATEVPPPSVAMIDANGNYSIPAAVVGSHTVTFLRPEPIDEEEMAARLEDEDPEEAQDVMEEMELVERLKDMPCNAVDDPEVEVAPGTNQIDIELVTGRGGEDD